MELIERIKANEGFSPRPYLCPTGHATIGYGCNLEVRPILIEEAGFAAIAKFVRAKVLKGRELVIALQEVGMEWNEAEAAADLGLAVDAAAAVVRSRWPWSHSLDHFRFGVMVEMAYQMGVSGLAEFKRFLFFMEAGLWAAAAAEMLDSKWAREDSPARARRLAEIVDPSHAPEAREEGGDKEGGGGSGALG